MSERLEASQSWNHNDAAMHGDMHGDGRPAKGAKGAKKKKGARK